MMVPGRVHDRLGVRDRSDLRVFVSNSDVILGGCGPTYFFYSALSRVIGCGKCGIYVGYVRGLGDLGRDVWWGT